MRKRLMEDDSPVSPDVPSPSVSILENWRGEWKYMKKYWSAIDNITSNNKNKNNTNKINKIILKETSIHTKGLRPSKTTKYFHQHSNQSWWVEAWFFSSRLLHQILVDSRMVEFPPSNFNYLQQSFCLEVDKAKSISSQSPNWTRTVEISPVHLLVPLLLQIFDGHSFDNPPLNPFRNPPEKRKKIDKRRKTPVIRSRPTYQR